MTPEQFEQRLGQLRARHALLKRGVLTCPRGVKRVVKLYKGIQALDAPRLLGFSEHTFDRYRKVAESPFLQVSSKWRWLWVAVCACVDCTGFGFGN